MKAEAEANAEADKKKKEEVEVVNKADSTIFQTERQMKEYGDKILNALESGVAVIGSDKGNKPSVVIVVTDDIINQGVNAANFAKIIGNEMGGGGGGKPNLATAGGKNTKTYTIAMKKSIDLIKSELIQ